MDKNCANRNHEAVGLEKGKKYKRKIGRKIYSRNGKKQDNRIANRPIE